MKFTQIKETCFYVADLDRTEDFYTRVMGFELIGKDPDRHVFFRVGSSVFLCFNPEKTIQEQELIPHYARGKQHVAFEVEREDYETIKRELEHRGVQITLEYTWNSRFKSFYFNDPDGHVLEVVPVGMWDH